MRIDSFQPSQISSDSAELQRKTADKSAKPVQTQDRAELSSTLNAQQQSAAPEIRQDRVDAIKQAMQSGTYNVSNSQLAAAMFNEFFNRG